MNDSIIDIFCDEAREHLAAMEKAFLDLETTADIQSRRNLINDLFRHAHSLKGDAKLVGLESLKTTAQALEDILDDLRVRPESAGSEAVGRGLVQLDLVRQDFNAWQSKTRTAAADDPVATRPSTTTATAPAPAEGLISGSSNSPEAGTELTPEDNLTVRVPSDRLDRMLNLIGELRISLRSADALASRLADLREHLTAQLKNVRRRSLHENRQSFEDALDQLRRIDGDLRKKISREQLLSESLEADIRDVRLLPLITLTDSLRRAVRELAHSLAKPIRFEVVGGEVMLDKAVIEALRDPLLHLIRNAADHGIETPAERRAASKPVEGLIRITAIPLGSMVQVAVSDDGRGVNFSRVREFLLRRAELSEAELSELSDRELVNCLFQPGFSTAPTGEVSGRGVGLDVVLNRVRRLQGTVELQSSSPAGATFALTVPIIVSSVRILTVVSGGQYYGVPTAAIRRTGRARPDELRELEGNLILPVEGRPVRWVHLADLLDTKESQKSRKEAARSYFIVKHQDQELAVVVEDMEDESEVLLKPLGFPLGGMPGIAGATIRADGAVQLVLDLNGTHWARPRAASMPRRTTVEKSQRILVVDDSPTTRAILRNMLTVAGYVVVTAKDGVEALELLQRRGVDLVVSDVDMPRLSGFDLTRHIKSKYVLPVILVTGRETEEHRREGLAAGADAYVVKSTFEDKGLLEIVQQFL